MGWLRNIVKIAGYTPYTGYGLINEAFSRSGGGTPVGSVLSGVGYQTPAAKRNKKELSDQAAADADAAARQTEFEASEKAGLERLALRRKKGYLASMIADPESSVGSSSTLGA